jgi:hypothetical protein
MAEISSCETDRESEDDKHYFECTHSSTESDTDSFKNNNKKSRKPEEEFESRFEKGI